MFHKIDLIKANVLGGGGCSEGLSCSFFFPQFCDIAEVAMIHKLI